MAAESALLQEICDAYENDSREWAEIHEDGHIDARIVAGDPWGALDPKGKQQRLDAVRPVLAPDEIGQYVNQVVNDLRENPRGVKFTANDQDATDDGATFYENKMREIEYRSRASYAYAMAFENAVIRGYGFIRLTTKYVTERMFDAGLPPDASLHNQEIWIEGFPDPNMVVPDPYCERTDLADQSRCTVLQWMPIADFKRQYGKDAKIVNFSPAALSRFPQSSQWVSRDYKHVLVAEAWRQEQIKTRTLLTYQPDRRYKNQQPVSAWKDELKQQPASDRILREREIPIYAVKQHITNGLEILDTHEWPGKYIPITGCFGKQIYLSDDGAASAGAKRKLLSLIRLARDPFMAYCYLWSCEAEIVGMTPKFPYFYYEGQLSADALDALVQSIRVPVAAIPVKPTIPGVTLPGAALLPFPQRNPYTGDAIQYLEIAKEAARRAIQAAMGISPLPTPAQQENEKSGEALKRIESSGQKGSFHFSDSFDGMLTQVGEIYQDLNTRIYDTARDLPTRDWDGTAIPVRVNDPEQPDSLSTKGEYLPTVSSGPSSASQKAAADDLVDSLVGNIAEIAQISGQGAAQKVLAESIRNKVQGPSGDKLADVISPPQTGEPTAQQMQQAMQENQQLKAALQEAQQALQTETIKYQSQAEIESGKQSAQTEREVRLKQMDIAGRIEVARITAAKQSADLQAEAREEAQALGLTHAHEMALQHDQNAHALGMAAVTHRQATTQAAQQHDQNMEAGQQGIAGQMAVQAAAPEPPTAPGAGA